MGADRADLCDDALLLGGQLRLFDESARGGRAVAAARVGALYAVARPPHDRAPRRLLAVRALADCARPTRRWQGDRTRSEEHTSELQSLMRISYAVFCFK